MSLLLLLAGPTGPAASSSASFSFAATSSASVLSVNGAPGSMLLSAEPVSFMRTGPVEFSAPPSVAVYDAFAYDSLTYA